MAILDDPTRALRAMEEWTDVRLLSPGLAPTAAPGGEPDRACNASTPTRGSCDRSSKLRGDRTVGARHYQWVLRSRDQSPLGQGRAHMSADGVDAVVASFRKLPNWICSGFWRCPTTSPNNPQCTLVWCIYLYYGYVLCIYQCPGEDWGPDDYPTVGTTTG
jgi:hypothetical protein